MALTAGSRLGVYEIIAPVGEGGMGQVWRATDTTLGRQDRQVVFQLNFFDELRRRVPLPK